MNINYYKGGCMKLSDLSIEVLSKYITGDCGYTPKLSGPKILELFRPVGIREVYNRDKNNEQPLGLPEGLSRNRYAEKILKESNGNRKLKIILESIIDSQHFAKDESLNRDVAVEKINEIIKYDGYKFQDFDGVYKITGEDLPDDVKVTPHFEGIQAQIIEQIRVSKYSIWVSVAWITDRTILNELYKKKKEGLSIRIIMVNDSINQKYLARCKEYFETKAVFPIKPYENLMHNKFCIIDSKTVISGSYNWTVKAQYNNENISIYDNREIAEKFMAEFMKLWNMIG